MMALLPRKPVLILLLMEYGHGAQLTGLVYNKETVVLILLLMEYGHGGNQPRLKHGRGTVVLILLLMEYGHGDRDDVCRAACYKS